MKPGDLVSRTRHSQHKHGVILKRFTMQHGKHSFYVHWFDLDPDEERHGWFSKGELRLINEFG